MSLRNKFIIILSSLVISISIAIIGVILFITISQMEEDAHHQFKDNLVAKRALVSKEIEDYFHSIEKQIISMAFDVGTKQAVTDFTLGFNQQVGSSSSNALIDYYENEYKALYDTKNEDKVNAQQLLNNLSPIARNFQNQYIADNVHPLGEKEKLDVGSQNNAYNTAHQKYHPTFRKFLSEFGFYDIFIVEPKSGHIIYSVYKELDYATSLINGPYKSSGIATAFNEALNLQEGEYHLTDFDSYVPSYNASASFISSPVYQNGIVIAVLIYQMPIEKINSLMIQDGHWLESGFGTSGEIYLVGEDSTLRSDSRFFVEDKQGYLDVLKAQKIDAWEEISKRETSISLQPVTTPGAKKALMGQTGFDTFNDYRGVEVLSAYAPMDVANTLNWAILSEIDAEEAYSGVKKLSEEIIRDAIFILIIVAIIAIVAAVVIANHLVRPLNELSEKVEQLSSGDADLTVVINRSKIPEINRVSDGVNRFIKKIHTLVAEIKTTIDVFATSGVELGATTEQTSQNIGKQSKNTEQVVESINALSTSIEQITQETKSAFQATENANQIAGVSTNKASLASNDIKKLAEQVQSSTHSIRELQASVEDIGDVLGVINTIADQTNLLALNAAIEAARAGEHGRGFSVVADEVRTLASKTQESTVTIQAQIEQLTSATSNAVNSMESATDSAEHGIEMVDFVANSITELSDVVKQIESMTQSISGQTETQSDSIEFITDSVSHLQDGTVEILQASHNINGVAGELSSIAEGLRTQTAEFKV